MQTLIVPHCLAITRGACLFVGGERLLGSDNGRSGTLTPTCDRRLCCGLLRRWHPARCGAWRRGRLLRPLRLDGGLCQRLLGRVVQRSRHGDTHRLAVGAHQDRLFVRLALIDQVLDVRPKLLHKVGVDVLVQEHRISPAAEHDTHHLAHIVPVPLTSRLDRHRRRLLGLEQHAIDKV